MTTSEIMELLPYEVNWNPRLFMKFTELHDTLGEEMDERLRGAGVYEKFVRAVAKWIAASAEEHSLSPITASELDEMKLPPVEWIVDGLIPTGIAMLAAPSKSYKSFMALQLCIEVCRGGSFLGRKCEAASTLYFDLESSKRRPQNRLKTILGDAQKPGNLFIVTGDQEIKTLGQGFEDQVGELLTVHPEIRLVVVDVFQLIRGPARRSESGYDRDYRDFKILRQIINKYGVCVLLIHHTRKMRDPDIFNQISGSVGIMGALDAALMIDREQRSDSAATLYVTGRDVEQQELAIEFDSRSCQWFYRGTAEEIASGKKREAYDNSPVIDVARKLVAYNGGKWFGSASDILAAAKVFGVALSMDVSLISRTLSSFEGELWAWDHIKVNLTRGASSRIISLCRE